MDMLKIERNGRQKRSRKNVKGILPSKEWLIRNGHRGLVKCMKEHPDMFAHIEQNKESIEKEM